MTNPQPNPTTLTDAELDRALITASRAYIAARTARPQNPTLVAATYAWWQALIAERDARAAAV